MVTGIDKKHAKSVRFPSGLGCLAALLLLIGLLVCYVLCLWFFGDSLRTRANVSAEIQANMAEVRRDPTNRAALDRMVRRLRGNWSFAATYAAGSLGELGPLAFPVANDLLWALNCGDPFVEREAARSLGPVTRGTDIAVDSLISKAKAAPLKDSAVFSVDSLGMIGKPALRAIPLLEEMAQYPEWLMSYSAKQALKKLRQLQDVDEPSDRSSQH